MDLARRALPIAALVLLADQGVKTLLRQTLVPCQAPTSLHACAVLALVGGVHLVRVESNGGLPGFLPLFSLSTLVSFLGLVLVPLYAHWLRQAGGLAVLAIGLQAGGALSNLVDRLVYGASLDYIPAGRIVFNLADIALLVGMVLAIVLLAPRIESAERARPEARKASRDAPTLLSRLFHLGAARLVSRPVTTASGCETGNDSSAKDT